MSPQLIRLRFPAPGLLFAPCICCYLRHLLGPVILAAPGDQHYCAGHCSRSMISPASRSAPRQQAIGAEPRIAERVLPRRHRTVPARQAVKWRTPCRTRSLCVLAAHLILELLAQLRAVVLTGELSYLLPLTQELIADVLGLSGPHASRMLRSLRKKDWSRSRDIERPAGRARFRRW
jgi:Crp-like helix-turn-helix domain